MSEPHRATSPVDLAAQDRTVTEAIAGPVARRRSERSRWVEVLLELGALDRAVHEAVATTPTPLLDEPLRRLTHAADAGAIWVGMAAVVALAGGQRGRRVATEAVASLAVTAVTVNFGAKSLFRRRRPDQVHHDYSPERHVTAPTSTSFPSGHAATSFAFAYTIGRHLPLIGVPTRLAAAAVAYSRVHIGVHYPGDVIIGSVMGASTGALVASTWDRRRARPSPELH